MHVKKYKSAMFSIHDHSKTCRSKCTEWTIHIMVHSEILGRISRQSFKGTHQDHFIHIYCVYINNTAVYINNIGLVGLVYSRVMFRLGQGSQPKPYITWVQIFQAKLDTSFSTPAQLFSLVRIWWASPINLLPNTHDKKRHLTLEQKAQKMRK